MKQTRAAARWVVLAVATLTALGLALRLARYQQTVFGDELSTLYGVDGRSFSEMMSYVSSDAEISPPFFFILAWLTTKLGSAAELVRLPSLIAGTISIPLAYLVGARAISRSAGLIAAGVMALSPVMIFYSADGRGYAVMIAFLLGSTLAMLTGLRTGRRRWWVAYGALSLLAMYTHYTAAFVLVGQLLWLLWAHPHARKPALLANLAAAVLYLPWAHGLAADFDSPTTDILYGLAGSGVTAKLQAVGGWAVGYPYTTLSGFLTLPPTLLGAAGLALAAAAGLIRHLRARAAVTPASSLPLVSPGFGLALALAASATGFALALLLITGNDLLTPRTLVASSAGLALLIGAVLAAAGRVWGSVCTVLVAASFAFGASGALATENELPDFKSAAAYIEAEAGPDDVVVDLMLLTGVTPVPLTPLDAYLTQGRPEYRIGLPTGEPPFLTNSAPPASTLLRSALKQSRGGSLFLVAGDNSVVRDGDEAIAVREGPTVPKAFELPQGSRIVAERRFPGLVPVDVLLIAVGGKAGAR